MTDQSSESDQLLMCLAVAYYTPLGWALDDGEEVDPDDLAECLRSMSPVAEAVREAVNEALESLDDLCRDEERHGEHIRAHEVRGAVADLRRLVTPPGEASG